MKILIFAAFRKEVQALVEEMRLEHPFETAAGGARWTSGDFKGSEVFVAVTGMGKQRALSAARALFELVRPDRILVIGAAGALAPTVGPLDLVVAEKVCAWSEGDRVPSWTSADDETAEKILRVSTAVDAGSPVHHGGLVSVEQPLLDASLRERLWTRTLAQAVDMEAAFLVQAAASLAVPAGVVKIVTDLSDSRAESAFRRNIHAAADKLMKVVIGYLEKGVPPP